MNAWQPIATAPRDGTRVLLFQRSDGSTIVVEGSFQEYPAEWIAEPIGAPLRPTHWMPLAEPVWTVRHRKTRCVVGTYRGNMEVGGRRPPAAGGRLAPNPILHCRLDVEERTIWVERAGDLFGLRGFEPL